MELFLPVPLGASGAHQTALVGTTHFPKPRRRHIGNQRKWLWREPFALLVAFPIGSSLRATPRRTRWSIVRAHGAEFLRTIPDLALGLLFEVAAVGWEPLRARWLWPFTPRPFG